MKQDKLLDNLKKGTIYTAGANFLAGLCFFAAYFFVKNFLLIIAAFILIIAGIGIIIFFKRLEHKYANLIDKNH